MNQQVANYSVEDGHLMVTFNDGTENVYNLGDFSFRETKWKKLGYAKVAPHIGFLIIAFLSSVGYLRDLFLGAGVSVAGTILFVFAILLCIYAVHSLRRDIETNLYGKLVSPKLETDIFFQNEAERNDVVVRGDVTSYKSEKRRR
ncbi:MAG: hypothetical protein DDT19_00010 [Syntrophomonadaceae bacterium]|nr:hypothetical protein [Bacillota bacterium]